MPDEKIKQEIRTGDIEVHGDRSTVTVEMKVVTGLTKDEFEQTLRNREQHFLDLLLRKERLSTEQRLGLERALGKTREDLEDLSTTFSRQERDLKDTLEALNVLTSEYGVQEAKRTHDAREIGDTALAELFLKQSIDKLAIAHAKRASEAAYLATQRSDNEVALNYIRLACQLQPNIDLYQHERGDLATRQGLLEEASEAFEASLGSHLPSEELFDFGVITLFDHWRLEFADFLLRWKKDPARARAQLGLFVPFASKISQMRLEGSIKFLQRFVQLCRSAGVTLPEGLTEEEQSAASSFPNVEEAIVEFCQKGNTLEAKGDIEGARENYQRAVELIGTLRRPDPFLIGIMNINLGGMRAKLGMYTEAESNWQAARKALGDKHPFVLNSISNFATSAKERDNLEVALRWTQEALEVAANQTSEFSTESLNLLQRLGSLLFDMGRLSESLDVFRRIYRAAEERRFERWTPTDNDELRNTIKEIENTIRSGKTNVKLIERE